MRRRISPFYGWVSKFIDFKIKNAIVEIRHVFGKGRGLCAIDTIKKKQEILRIPRKLIMTADDAVNESLFGRTMVESGLSEGGILASHIAECYQATRPGRYPKSLQWKVYAQCLPRKTACLTDWGRPHYNKPTHDSPFTDILRTESLIQHGVTELSQITQRLYNPIVTVRQRNSQQIIQDTLSTKNIDFGVSQLHSRAVPVEFLDNKLAFIPFIDFCNHNVQDASRLVWDEKTQEIVLLAGRKYHKNEEVEINFYGKNNNREHFFFHGFVPGTNADDYFPFQLGLDEKDPFYQQKFQVLLDLNLPTQVDYKVPSVASVPQQVLQFAQFAVCEPSCGEQLLQIAQLLFKENKSLSIQGKNLKVIALPYIARHLAKQLDNYNENSYGDMNLVSELRMLPGANLQFSDWVNCSAAALRKSESQILSSNHTFMKMKVEELKAKLRGQFV